MPPSASDISQSEESNNDDVRSSMNHPPSDSSSSISGTVVTKSTVVSSRTGLISENGTSYYTTTNSSGEKLKTSELRKSKSVRHVSFDNTRGSSSVATSEVAPPLDFESLGIVGRDTEISKLRTCLGRMMKAGQDHQDGNEKTPNSAENGKEFVLIGGSSGSGKTMVVSTLENEVTSMGNSKFVRGKFDMNASNEPFSGVAKAFNEICCKIKDSDEDVVKSVKDSINKDLGEEAALLVHLVPELKDLFNDETNDEEVTNIGTDEIEYRLERMRFAFCALMRVFSSAFSPLLVFLDDLQWADISSLQILDFLISDTRNENNLMILGSYRTEEVDENSLLHQKAIALREKATKHNFHMTEMMIQPFKVDDIQKVIEKLLPSPNASATEGLASLCLKRTLGNPFFVMEFLKMLHQERLLQHDTLAKYWIWDLSKIEAATMSTANVVAMLHNHLTKLSQQQRALLQCAAYLGSKFSETTIDLIWGTYGRRLVESRIERTSILLEAIVEDKILEKCDNNKYRWIHDKLQEAALSLTGKQRESFQLDIGRTLYYGLDKQKVEDELFAIVDLINNGNTIKLTEFASANLRAAEKARELSAFQSAAMYATHGIRLLTENKWTENESLTLKLYIMAAEMETLSGNIAAADRYAMEVLSQKDFPTMKTLPLKILKANTIGSVDLKFDEATAQCIQILRDLGCRLTWTKKLVPVQALSKLVRTVKKAKAKPKEFYDAIVPIDDPKQKAIASLISKLVYFSFASGDMMMNLLCTCKLVDMTLEYGVNEYSAKSFSALSNAVTFAFQDYDTATNFNMIALSMLDQFRGMHNSETTFIAYAIGLTWVTRIEDCLRPLQEAVNQGLRVGETEFALWNAFAHLITLPYSIGKPLSSIIGECPRLLIHCKDLAQKAHVLEIEVLWQMLHNIAELACPNPTDLEGEIYSISQDLEKNPLHLSFLHLAIGEVLFFNADYEVTAKRAVEFGERFNNLLPNNCSGMIECFHRAVALYAAARRTNKRKFRREAKRLYKKIEKWLTVGNPNVVYYHLFLTAEQLALEKKYDMAEQKYKEALDLVTLEGHLHHIALVNERYADFLLEARSQEDYSKVRLKEAIRYYTEWGAMRKVKRLEMRL